MTHGDKCETRNVWGYVTIPVYEYDSLKEAQSERAQLAAALVELVDSEALLHIHRLVGAFEVADALIERLGLRA